MSDDFNDTEKRLQEHLRPIVRELDARLALGYGDRSAHLAMTAALEKALRAGYREGAADIAHQVMTTTSQCPHCGQELRYSSDLDVRQVPDPDIWADEFGEQ